MIGIGIYQTGNQVWQLLIRRRQSGVAATARRNHPFNGPTQGSQRASIAGSQKPTLENRRTQVKRPAAKVRG
jgi:hypothetical protein